MLFSLFNKLTIVFRDILCLYEEADVLLSNVISLFCDNFIVMKALINVLYNEYFHKYLIKNRYK